MRLNSIFDFFRHDSNDANESTQVWPQIGLYWHAFLEMLYGIFQGHDGHVRKVGHTKCTTILSSIGAVVTFMCPFRLMLYGNNQRLVQASVDSKVSSRNPHLWRTCPTSLTTYCRRPLHFLVCAAIVTVSLIPVASAMCVSTTRNLLRIELYSCQPVKIGANISRSDNHARHKRGARVTGALITGRVVTSDSVWMLDSRDKDNIMEVPIVPEGTVATFFLEGPAKDTCNHIIGSILVLVTDRPCCDLIPASGLCLVPESLAIVRKENLPDRWSKWRAEAVGE